MHTKYSNDMRASGMRLLRSFYFENMYECEHCIV